MSRSTLVRLEKLEQATGDKRSGRILVVGNSEEAARLRAEYPEALIICTGVSRSVNGANR